MQLAKSYHSKSILFVILPILLTLILTTSLFFKSPTLSGFMNNPIPLGVPVIITVPFLNVVPRLKYLITFATLQIISLVPVSYLSSPLILVLSCKFCGSTPIISKIDGLTGAKPSKDFVYENWPLDTEAGIWKFLAETSFLAV